MSASAKAAAQDAAAAFREPFTFDVLCRILDKVPFSPPFLLLIPALTYFYDRQSNPTVAYPPSFAQLRELIFTAYPWAGRAVLFILAKTINRLLTRYVRNHGEWRADKPDWKKDVVVITGGSTGIGKATVEILSRQKRAKIAVLDMAPPQYAPAAPGAPEILYIKCDVADENAVKAAADQIRKTLGTPTLIMNNAGIASGSRIMDCTPESTIRLWKVNTLAHWVITREFLPDIIKKNHGHFVSVSSSAAYSPLPQLSQYAVSKAGALAFHEVLAAELATRYNSRKVRTTVVCPTKVRTALGDGMEDHPDPFFTPVLEPVQVAQKIVDAYESGLSQHIIAPMLMNMLPWLRVMPDWMKRIIAIVGKTDFQISDKSISRSLNNGYMSKFEGEDKVLLERTKADMLQKKQYGGKAA